jgi:hypothetical protein
MTLSALVLAALVPLLSQSSQPPESKPVPSDSFRIVTTGCLKGRVFTAVGPRQEDPTSAQGPSVTGRSFRVAGPRPLMDQVKEHNGHLVEITGLVLKSALLEPGPGMRVGNTRIGVGAPPPSTDPAGMSARSPQGGLPVMDATSVSFLEETCPIPRK